MELNKTQTQENMPVAYVIVMLVKTSIQ